MRLNERSLFVINRGLTILIGVLLDKSPEGLNKNQLVEFVCSQIVLPEGIEAELKKCEEEDFLKKVNILLIEAGLRAQRDDKGHYLIYPRTER